MPPRDSWHLYREPYFGGGAVLFRMDPEGLSEAVNDIDEGLTNFWMMLRSPAVFSEFYERAKLIPFSEAEWINATSNYPEWMKDSCKFTSALAFFIRYRQSRQGLGKDFATPTSRLRRGMNENVSSWLSAVEGLPEAHERLKRVEIRNMDAVEFIRKYDHYKAVHYCDPPYLHETRTSKDVYEHEMDSADHLRLIFCLSSIKGRFLLSGYHSKMYDKAASEFGWNCHEKEIDNKASSKKKKEKKIECVWTNY